MSAAVVTVPAPAAEHLPHYHGVTMISVRLPAELHSRSKFLLHHFAEAMAVKLRASEIKYGFAAEWLNEMSEDECRRALRAHLAKGDPLDVAIYAAFMCARGWRTV